MLKLRLKRIGRKRQPLYRLVVIPNGGKRNGNGIDQVGYYNPFTKITFLERNKILDWFKKGIQPTKTVKSLLLKNNLIINK